MQMNNRLHFRTSLGLQVIVDHLLSVKWESMGRQKKTTTSF